MPKNLLLNCIIDYFGLFHAYTFMGHWNSGTLSCVVDGFGVNMSPRVTSVLNVVLELLGAISHGS